jgi:phosphatidylinositol 4-phosphatase
MALLQTAKFPYRDVNLKVSSDAYTFTSPSSPDAPALVLDRPTGDVRLHEGALPTGKRVSRVSSIAGILGIIQLRLGQFWCLHRRTPPLQEHWR